MARRTGQNIKLKPNAGLTLIEVVLAAGVITMAMVSVYSGLASMTMLAEVNEGKAAAVGAVSSLLEEVQTMEVNSLANYLPPDISMPGRAHWVGAEIIVPSDDPLDPDAVESISVPNGSLDMGNISRPVEFKISIYWEDSQGRLFSYNASTLVE